MNDDDQLLLLDHQEGAAEAAPPKEYDGVLPDKGERMEVFRSDEEGKWAVIVVRHREADVLIRAWLSDPSDAIMAKRLIKTIRHRFTSDPNLLLVVSVTQSAMMALLSSKESITGTYMQKVVKRGGESSPSDSHQSVTTTKYRHIEEGHGYDSWLDKAIDGFAIGLDSSSGKASDPVLSAKRSRAAIEQTLPQGIDTKGHSFVALLDDDEEGREQQVGTIWFDIKADTRKSFLYNVQIDAEHQRKGHGRRIMALWEQLARKQGAEILCLHVFEYNAAAKALYLNIGFQVNEVSFRL